MTIRLADKNIRIRTVYEETASFCRNYAIPDAEEPDFEVCTQLEDIEQERLYSRRTDELEGRAPRPFSDAYLETLALYRKIAEKMPEYGTFLFHGSCVAVDGMGYLFTAKSGTGKSTHSRLWRELLGDKAVMVNDDKPLIHIAEDGVAFACGTPWDGKHRLSTNMSVPLKAICILERSAENRIRKITKTEAMPMLIQQSYRPADPAALACTLKLLDRMNVQFYRLGCNMDISAAELSYHTMKEEHS